MKSTWRGEQKKASGRLFLLTLGSKRSFSSHFESFLQSFSGWRELRLRDDGWQKIMLIEEIPSNWKKKVEFLEGFFQICVCGNGGFECFTRCTFTEKRAKSLHAEIVKCTICFQKCATRSLERGDSLACVCEERFLRKGRGKSYFTFKSYCQDRT